MAVCPGVGLEMRCVPRCLGCTSAWCPRHPTVICTRVSRCRARPPFAVVLGPRTPGPEQPALCLSVGGVLGKWARGKTEPTDKLTLLSGSIASGESRTGLGWLPSALQHSILLIIDPALPSGPQYNPGQHPEALKRRSGRGSRQLILSRRPCRRFLADTRVSPSAASLLALVSESGPGCQKRPNRR